MGLMLEALKQIETGTTPVHVERFVFPAVPELPECTAPAAAPRVVWPECHDTKTASACAEMAAGILRQLSGRTDTPVCSLDRPTVVALTSPGDGDGKTSLLLAVAPHLAKRMAGDILVADANYRKPDLTARLHVPGVRRRDGSAGAQASCPPPAAESAALPICSTNLQQLNFLPAPVGGSGFDQCWIDELRENWPLVLLDAPSLAHREAAPLARCCDGVYLVVRLGHTPRRAVAEAAHVLRAKGGRLLGCLVVR